MPIRIPKETIKMTCKNCQWYLIVNSGGFGDLLSPTEMMRLLLNRVEKCPECGSLEFSDSEPSSKERYNPVEYFRKVKYAFGSYRNTTEKPKD